MLEYMGRGIVPLPVPPLEPLNLGIIPSTSLLGVSRFALLRVA